MIQKSNDFDSAKKKIAQYLMHKNITHYEFSKKTGLANGFLNSGTGVNSDTLRLISKIFDDLNILWVITGEGEMIKENAAQKLSPKVEPKSCAQSTEKLSPKLSPIQENDTLNVTPKCNPNVSPQTIDNVTPIVTPIQENDSIELSPKSKPNFQAQSAGNLSPNLSPIQKNDFTDNNNLYAQSAHSNSMLNFEHTPHDDALKVCQACIEKDNMIVMLKDFIKSKDETINAKNEAVIALNKALIAKDEALIAKDEAIRSKNELIEELLQKDDLDFDDMPISSAS